MIQRFRWLPRLLPAWLALFCAGAPAWADEHTRLDGWVRRTVLARDLTSETSITQDLTILDGRGVQQAREATSTFHPGSQNLDVTGWVEAPDGTRRDVSPSAIYRRPTAATRAAPGFTDEQSVTVVFPGLEPGAHRHVVWRFRQVRPPLVGFLDALFPPDVWRMGGVRDEIELPADVPLRWRTRGSFSVEDQTEAGTRHIVIEPALGLSPPPERNVVDALDDRPLFLATTLPDLATLGRIYHDGAAARSGVTPEIAALASRIVGSAEGPDAARLIHDWIASHITYLAVRLDAADGWVPHPAADVLHNGFGDCKDHVALMEALLQARGIRSEAVLVDAGNRHADLMLPIAWFNHAIIHLPDLGLYDDPTDQRSSFGTLGRGLGDKQVVIASADGAVDRLPLSRPADFAYERDSTLKLDLNGGLEGTARITATPAEAESIRARIVDVTPEIAVENALRATPEGGFGTLTGTDPHDLDAPFALTAHWTSPRAVPIEPGQDETPVVLPSGLDFDAVGGFRNLLVAHGRRRSDLSVGVLDGTWRTELQLPGPDWSIKRLPPPVAIDDGTASFTATYALTDGALHVMRHLVVRDGIIPPARYPGFAAVLTQALDDARRIVVLVHTPSPTHRPASPLDASEPAPKPGRAIV